ncbi:PREDICTED: putative late blight resistance protein homolog R1B-16 isoform X1 [Ipomoea nil]|uniref:putative late blight resistance protein homolog R1B-16 isoform X1 n=1 Tax=Ipomoea nil TaxID=35883 RepID=UPI0009018183|nr:PREDICTED: putative late blight resistance protein homolog R1B-16 isoform X1 [Ipomoea nil]XP_019184315.1 PREDICTED: putative late blight resistance protein homolog R1B-16 isoform X1 [Ipomoea nil]XP_019184316.1 PREDICTED: putative late blight resistance protein homolog R1B-16 isoform X1 [Ipomoea nil]
MQLLGQSEGWKLFNEKACKSRGAEFETSEFETIGRPVVEKCKGLPLAIIVVAGLFSKLNTLEEWKNTANALSFSSTTTLDDEECSRILSLSYNHLTHNLKACFLYLGVFPEDHKIHANNLGRLWLAEGLVKAFENEEFDAVANRYMLELMDRNLIILSQLSPCGRKIKSFRMHDLLHAFCVREAQKENLLHVVLSENRSDFPQKGFRWVSIQSVNFDMSTIRSQSKSWKSFLYFLLEESSLEFNDFNLLRVLYSSTKSMKVMVLTDIVHLRLLILKQNIKLSRARGFLKPRCRKGIELSRSWNLQTLLCSKVVSYRSDDGGNYSEFPQLQYIRCYDGFIHGNPPSFVHKLFRIRVDDCTQEYIKNIPFLKKVGIVCEGRDDYNGCITNLASSEQLEGLHFGGTEFYIHSQFTNHIVLLKNLRTLSLFFVVFDSDGIDILSKLPRLEVLKLKYIGFRGAQWKIQEEVIFCQLIFLEIFCTPLEHWEASSHNFPKLEHLYIRFCYKLREIPIDFAEISTLKSIKLRECLHSAVESAKKILDEQRDYGNNDMVVIKKETLNVSESEESLSEEEPDQKWITDN